MECAESTAAIALIKKKYKVFKKCNRRRIAEGYFSVFGGRVTARLPVSRFQKILAYRRYVKIKKRLESRGGGTSTKLSTDKYDTRTLYERKVRKK